MTQDEFIKKYKPYAEKVHQRVGQPVRLTLSQWALETGWGESELAKRSNNLGGIKYSTYSTGTKETRFYKEMGYARYSSLNQFIDDYVRVMNLRYYDNVRKAYDTPGIEDDITELHKSPYAEDTKYDLKLRKIADSIKDKVSEVISPADPEEQAKNMSKDELIKYAAIGLAAVTLINLVQKG